MTDKYQNKYRIASARLKNWDYRTNAAYFVTICTKNREHFFGEIVNGKMQLSEIGGLANKYLIEIPKHFPFAKLDTFAVMPNHVHCIIIIDNPENDHNNGDGNSNDRDNGNGDDDRNGSTDVACNSAKYKNEKMVAIAPKSGSLSTIIRSYKSAVSKNARIIHADFGWQPRFHDHIIRDNKSHQRIETYIMENPLK